MSCFNHTESAAPISRGRGTVVYLRGVPSDDPEDPVAIFTWAPMSCSCTDPTEQEGFTHRAVYASDHTASFLCESVCRAAHDGGKEVLYSRLAKVGDLESIAVDPTDL